MEELVDITGVEVVGDHRLRLTFADRTVVDLAPEPLYEEARRNRVEPASSTG